jgi:hypothetical protein
VLYGSADLLNSLIKHDLVDEYRIMVFPVVLGSGKRLFRDAAGSGGSRRGPVNDRTTTSNDPVACERNTQVVFQIGQRRRSEDPALLPCQGGGRGFESRRPLQVRDVLWLLAEIRDV